MMNSRMSCLGVDEHLRLLVLNMNLKNKKIKITAGFHPSTKELPKQI